MENPQRFTKFEKTPFSIRLIGVLCDDKEAYESYKESYKELLSLVRKGVIKGAISEEEALRILQKCRK